MRLDAIGTNGLRELQRDGAAREERVAPTREPLCGTIEDGLATCIARDQRLDDDNQWLVGVCRAAVTM